MAKVRYKRPKRSRPGRKVYRTSSSFGHKRRDAASAVKVALGIVGLAVLVFIGYSIGAPIQRYIYEKRGENEKTDESGNTETEYYDDRLPNAVTSFTDFDLDTQTQTETAAENKPAKKGMPDISEIKGASVSTEAMNDSQALADEVSRLKDLGFNAAVFTLKDKGGDIYFRIDSPFASFAGGENIRSELFADEIASAAKSQGLIAVAKINLLQDSNTYGDTAYGSYKDAVGNLWTDSSGNSWLSPYDENTFGFISDISSEISAAGFDYIIISGLSFPDFSTEDYSTLGDALAYGGRYAALVRAANTVYKSTANTDCKVILEADAAELENGNAEAVRPDELLFNDLAVIYEDKNSPVLSEWKGMKVIPVFSGGYDDVPDNCIIY